MKSLKTQQNQVFFMKPPACAPVTFQQLLDPQRSGVSGKHLADQVQMDVTETSVRCCERSQRRRGVSVDLRLLALLTRFDPSPYFPFHTRPNETLRDQCSCGRTVAVRLSM